jgi:anti-anti-sigma factor
MATLARAGHLQVVPGQDGIVVKFICKEFDEMLAYGLTDELFDVAADAGRYNVCLDFWEVEFLSSVVLGKLLVLDRKLRGAGGRLTMLNLNPKVFEVFHVSRCDDFLDVHVKAEPAVAS